MPAIAVPGAALHYEVVGSPALPALLLLNSLGTDRRMWDDQMPQLIPQFRVIRYDVRGHGQSAVHDHNRCSIATLASDALAVLDAVGVQVAHWCGLSLGGMTAMWVAANHRERVGKLVLCNTSAYLPPPQLWQSRIDLVLREGMQAIVNGVTDRWFTPHFRATEPLRVNQVGAMLMATDPVGYAAACAAIRDMDQRSQLPHITARTLVVAGGKDPATPRAHSDELVAAIADSQLITLPTAHLSNIERPLEFSASVARFLCSSGKATH